MVNQIWHDVEFEWEFKFEIEIWKLEKKNIKGNKKKKKKQ
jgi:hypothetical protein